MRISITQMLTIVLLTLAGTLGAIIVGLLVHGSDVFNPASPGFSFVSFGLSGGLIFAFYHVRGISEAITAGVVASAVQFVAASAYITMLRAIVFSFGLNIPVIVVAFLFERKLATLKQAKFVVIALAYGVMFVLLTFLVDLLTGYTGLPASVFRENFLTGLFLGLGLGLGIEAGEALLQSYEHHVPTHKRA